VLAGVIGGLLAQGVALFDAARLGVALHARAGEIVRREIGEAGAVAGDLLLRLPRAIGELRG
jgi:ADP-dependent NAD(P)H-hydrate dehydratase / NAD(P)H-hydrate epimerase